MENNNESEINVNEFNMASPVYRLNFDSKNTTVIAGMYLATNENYRSILDKFVDKSSINRDSTYLFFAQRHIAEVFSIAYGVLSIIPKAMDNYNPLPLKFVKYFSEVLEYRCCITEEELNNHVNEFICGNSDIITQDKEKFMYILGNIWFLPYDKIDTLVRLGIDEFNQEKKG
jgi:hypothetical protein